MREFLLFWVGLLFLGSVGVKGQTIFGNQKTVSDIVDSPNIVTSSDLDGDGDMDIISSSLFNDKLIWYENDGQGNFLSNYHTVTIYVDWILSVATADLDNDGDIDLLSASLNDNKIAWYENDGNGSFSSQKIISTDVAGAEDVAISDLDGDGDLDVLSASINDNKVAWYKNDGLGNFSNQIIISTFTQKATSVHIFDIEGDGDDDVGVSGIHNKIYLFENDGKGNFLNGNVLYVDVEVISAVYTADLNNDEAIDIIYSSDSDNEIGWYKNDGTGKFGIHKIISTSVDWLTSIYTEDLDGDSDLDIVSTDRRKHQIIWFENMGNEHFSDVYLISEDIEQPSAIHSADLDMDGDMDIVVSSFFSDKLVWYPNLYDLKQIQSFIFQDLNENGLYDNNEKPLTNQQILIRPITDATFSDSEGHTYFFVKNGEYQLSAEPSTLWELTTPETYNITVTNNSELPTYYFGFKPTRTIPRVEPHLNSSPTRCNTTSNYWLHYSNTGTTIANGTVTLEVDELMDFVSANPQPNNIEGNTLMWNFSELYPSYENKIHLQYQIPDFNSIGEILETQATVQVFNENNMTIYTKTTEYKNTVLCSYDPNDKLVRSNLLGQSELAYIADTIHYTVRFQNTGNDTAFNIRIEDILDKKLDWTTFHPITASHDYRTELNRVTGLVTFHFEDIMLPDSTTNEPESHGFVMFGIASLENLEDKIEVDNTASIFFDFNPPIITNTATLTLLRGDVGIEGIDNSYSISVRPNPFSDFTTIEVNGLSLSGNYRLEVRDILGRKVRQLIIDSEELIMEREKLESGLYLIQVLEEESNRVLGSGKVLVE